MRDRLGDERIPSLRVLLFDHLVQKLENDMVLMPESIRDLRPQIQEAILLLLTREKTVARGVSRVVKIIPIRPMQIENDRQPVNVTPADNAGDVVIARLDPHALLRFHHRIIKRQPNMIKAHRPDAPDVLLNDKGPVVFALIHTLREKSSEVDSLFQIHTPVLRQIRYLIFCHQIRTPAPFPSIVYLFFLSFLCYTQSAYGGLLWN